MKRLGSILTVLTVLSMLLAAPASAETQSFTFSVSGPTENPCNGEGIAFTGNAHGNAGVTVSNSGNTHLRTHINYQGVTGVGVLGTLYQLPTVSNFNNNVGRATTFTFVANVRVISKGFTPNFNGHQTFHVTFNANGETTVSADNAVFHCNG